MLPRRHGWHSNLSTEHPLTLSSSDTFAFFGAACCSDSEEKRIKDAQMRAAINQQLVESGEKERCVYRGNQEVSGPSIVRARPGFWALVTLHSGSAPANSAVGCCRLKEALRQKLVECGWQDQLKAFCKGEREAVGRLSLPR